MNGTKSVFRHPDADAEAKSAAYRYAMEAGETIAGSFVLELEQAITKIQATPQLYTRIFGDARRVLLPDFPYAVIYRETLDRILILAIAHGSRRPGYWRRRVV